MKTNYIVFISLVFFVTIFYQVAFGVQNTRMFFKYIRKTEGALKKHDIAAAKIYNDSSDYWFMDMGINRLMKKF